MKQCSDSVTEVTMVLKHVVTETRIWYLMVIIVLMVVEAMALNGPNVCMVQQKYNITKRVKYRAPMSVRTYEWCFSMPPRCSKWRTEMRELTKLETDERIAEVAVCCPGYKMKDVSCVPICPNGKTGHHCSEDCPPMKWGPNCVNDCKPCAEHGACSPITGDCSCQDGWQGESCKNRMTTTTTSSEDLLTKATKPTPPSTPAISSSTALIETTLVTALSTSTQATLNFKTPITEYILNTTPMLTTISSTVTTLPTTVKVVPTTEATSTTPLSTSHKVVVTEEPRSTEAILPSKKPAVAHKTKIIATTEKKEETTRPVTVKPSTTSTTTSSLAPITIKIIKPTELVEKTTEIATNVSMYNRTEAPHETKTAKDVFVEVKSIQVTKTKTPSTETAKQHKTIYLNTTLMPIFTTYPVTTEGIRETTRRPDATIRYFPTTVKFKPKEIWIRPAQKGESIETKTNKDLLLRHKATNSVPNTTPKTIIVSIIPTSISTTFKKIVLTTASTFSQTHKSTLSHKTSAEVTKPITLLTTSSPEKLTTKPTSRPDKSSKSEPHIHKVTKPTFHSKELSKTTISASGTNSMFTVNKTLTSFTTVAPSTNAIKTAHNITKSTVTKSIERVTKHPIIKIVTVKPRNVTIITVSGKNNDTIQIIRTVARDVEKTNITKTDTKQNIVTESPEEETFHILTEPEHITAVMEGKDKERTSVDLISVISIAGGIMMAVITVAVIIVMVERCRRPRYDDVRKMNDIHMQVMIDNNDVPPPYVRSIFHTPLPDPPSSEKCHYQPISTLDRNLKQFMRPVVVQTISPIMLENFRGILECHYDHLPRRSYNFEAHQKHCSLAPSTDDVDELTCLRPCSVTESTIEALKCEAKLDMIDHTTSEPLYAEIPCWRPPSEHAIEVINLNGEAVTEL